MKNIMNNSNTKSVCVCVCVCVSITLLCKTIISNIVQKSIINYTFVIKLSLYIYYKIILFLQIYYIENICKVIDC